MKKAKTFISLLLATALICMLMPAVVSADASVTISASGSQDCLITLSLNISGVTADSYEYQWYHNVDNQENGTYVPICLGTGATYMLSANDIETWIKCEVTPITGGVRGATITSDKYHLEASYKLFRVSAVGASDSENNPTAYFVNIAGENILILDEYQDSVYAITAPFKGWHKFGDASTYLFDPTDSSNIGYWLNNDFLTNNQISASMQPYLINKKWWVGGACDKAKSPYSFNAKVSLLSVDEYAKYHDRIGWGPYSPTGDWWLRNSRGWTAGPNINLVMITLDPSKKGQTGGSRTGDASCLIRPTFYLDDDIFLEQKVNVSTMGSGIKEMFLRRYTADQLSSIYSDYELSQIGFEVNSAILTSSDTPAKACSTLTAAYTDENAVSYEYAWYTSSDGSAYKQIITQSAQTYTVSNDDMNKYIKAYVTPVYANGTKGTAASTNSINVTKLGQMNRTGYGDDREANKTNPTTNFVKIGGEEVLILEEYEGATDSFYVLSANVKGRAKFDADNTTKFDPTDSNNIGYVLNNDILNGTFSEGGYTYGISSSIRSYIPTHTWWTEAGHSGSNSPDDYSVSAKIGLLSRSEYGKFWGKFGWDPLSNIAGWWLRSGRGAGGTATSVFVSVGTVGSNYPNAGQNDWANTWNRDASRSDYYIRPAFYLNEDVFTNVKADISTMGSDVKEMFLRRYTPEQLSGIYSDSELAQIGFEVNGAVLTSSDTPAKACSTLTATYSDENAVSYEYEWYTSNDGSTYKQIRSQSSQTYSVSNDDMNKYIKAVVIPVYQDGTKGVPSSTNSINVTKLGRLNRTGYSTDREDNKENNGEYCVSFGGETVIILEEYEDSAESFYVLSANVKGRAKFDADNTTKFDPTDSNNIGYVLNNDILNGTFVDSGYTYGISSSIRSYIPTHTWWTEAGHSGSNSSSDYSVDAKIGLLSRSEYGKFWGKFGWDPSSNITGWWLRSGRGEGGTATSVFVSIGTLGSNYPNAGQNDWANTWNRDASRSDYYIRPAFYLNENVFRNVKANVSTMGSAVKAMLVNRYDKSELAGLYTDSELEQIGFQSDISIAAKYKDVYQRSEAVAQIHYVAEDMGDITITYTNGTVSDSTTEFMYPDDVYEDTLALSKLPLGENNVVITITDEMDNVLSERTQKMYIVADQPAVDIHNSGIAFHIDIGKKDNLELIRKLGFTRIRADFPWERIETSSGFNFTQTDTFMAETARLGISVVPILSYNNSIYSDDGNVKGAVNTAAERAAFVNYVRAVAGRYPGITEYEIWNEPNADGFWSGAANVNEYSSLVTAASAALYEINPDIKVYAGSIDVSKSGDSFAGSMFSNGLYDYMDALSIHPYFRTGGTSFDSRLSTYKSIILNNGGFKKLAATEFNFNISSGETDVTRGREAAKAMVLAEANNVDDVFFYTLVSDDYGLLDTEYELKSTIFPLSYVNSVLADARFIGKTTSGSISKYVFIKTSGEEVSICWSSSSSSYTLQSGETAYDMNGNALSGSSVAISSAPVYIFGTHNANSAKTAEINSRISAITSRYPSITSSMLSASNAKARIMATSLSEKDKSTALYMLHEVKKIEAVYASLTNTSDLTIPSRTLAAADHGNNVYAKAALKLAGSYVSECQKVSDMSFTGKNNILAADIMIANDLIESALLLAPATAPAIKDVKVVNGLLTFSVKNIQSGDVWVATYASGVLTDLKAVDINNLSCEVGNGAGKIFVWDGLRPLCPAAAFGN